MVVEPESEVWFPTPKSFVDTCGGWLISPEVLLRRIAIAPQAEAVAYKINSGFHCLVPLTTPEPMSRFIQFFLLYPVLERKLAELQFSNS